uniref:Innexin n=1 Tax=Syphacia muris TaxID=451379 RepID=A0A0N5AXY4_9BILA
DQLGSLIQSITKPRYEEDCVDRLNYRITSYIILLAAFTIIAKSFKLSTSELAILILKEYGGDPIQCWLPAELASKSGWEQYARDYCFVENTYFVKLDEALPKSDAKIKERRELTYYQWVPFLLLFQALMFTVPHIFWRMLNWTSGIHTRAVISMASDARQSDYNGKEMKQTVNAIVTHLHQSLRLRPLIRHISHSNPLIAFSRTFCSSYLSSIYLTTKLLFIMNGITQFWLLSIYLGSTGLQQLLSLSDKHSWQNSGFFPRVTLCDFQVRGIGNSHQHTIQCVLMANMLNEKIFIALWWWIVALILLTIGNFIYWIFVIASEKSKLQFVRGLLQLGKHEKKLDEYNLDSFVKYLGGDGIFILRLMIQNAGDIVTSIITEQLFEMHFTLLSKPYVDNRYCDSYSPFCKTPQNSNYFDSYIDTDSTPTTPVINVDQLSKPDEQYSQLEAITAASKTAV